MYQEMLFIAVLLCLISEGFQASEGVYLSLKGTVYADNSVIPITEIGEINPNTGQNEGLQCVTDRSPCCAAQHVANRLGEWFFPDGTTVPRQGVDASFYRTRGDDGTVNLNKVNSNVMSPTGLFCCQVPNATDVMQRVCADIVSVITPSAVGTPTAGETFSLNCSVSGTTDPATYQWINSNGTQLSNVDQLVFSRLLASDAGLYTCQATVGGVMVEGTATVNVSLPAPTSVMVTAPMGTIIAGSSPNLTCIVELSPAMDVPVTVDTVWTAPARTMVTPTSSVMESLTRYTIMAMVNASRNGDYTCQATVSSSSQFITDSEMISGSTTITVAPLPSPVDLMASSHNTTSFTLTWDQSQASVVDSYEIKYTFTINHCHTPDNMYIKAISGSLREHTIINNSITPVEEDSQYFISLIAWNSVGRSAPVHTNVSTMQAIPSEGPQLVRAINRSTTSITMQWGKIECSKRNGVITQYRIDYSSTFHTGSVSTISDVTIFDVNGLQPQTNYRFVVVAENNNGFSPRTNSETYTTLLPRAVSVFLGDHFYKNNSIVNLTDIGKGNRALFCISNRSYESGNIDRDWYFPDGSVVSQNHASTFYRNKDRSVVRLHRRNNALMPTGVFHCKISAMEGNRRIVQNIYVGVYPIDSGSPSITSVAFDRNSTTLICTSTGGPPTTVTWRKNGVLVNASLYQQSQRLVDAESATYENVLSSIDIAYFVGTFTCEVSNVRDTVQQTHELNGVSIIRDQFSIGLLATATCRSDDVATKIEWLADGEVLKSRVSTRELELVFSPVNDSIHNSTYICRVFRESDSGVPDAEQNFTVRVDGLPNAVTASISRSGTPIAGEDIMLNCMVSKTADGLIYSPTAMWIIPSEQNDSSISTSKIEASISVLTFDPLKTSHGGNYTCRGTLASLASIEPLKVYSSEQVTVQISSPRVHITHPRGLLYAGIHPLTLTCTISVNSTSDHGVRQEDVNITWLRRGAPLSVSDRRVAINMPFTIASQPLTFAGNITMFPSSVTDSRFTCMARIRHPLSSSFISESDVGQQTINVSIQFPKQFLFLNDEFYTNNSLVDLTNVGSTNSTALLCLTNSTECCANQTSASRSVWGWYFPNGAAVRSNHTLYSRGDLGRISLNRLQSSMIPPSGIYRCDVPNKQNTMVHSIYVGVYPPGSAGSPVAARIEFDSSSQTLTCTSTGGPITTIVWKRNETLLTEYDRIQRIEDVGSATYANTLSLNEEHPNDVIGLYECSVSNSRATIHAQFHIYGLQITMSAESLSPGDSLSINCTTDLAVTRIELLDSSGNVLACSNGTHVSLQIFEITETHNNQEYTCRTIGPFGNQTGTRRLKVQIASNQATVAGATASVLLIVLIIASGIVLITIAIWKLRKQDKLNFSVIPKCRHVIGNSESLEDHDYVTAPDKPVADEDCLEMKEYDEEKDKDYYFMDANLIASERVKPIPVSEFSGHVERLHTDRDKLFEMEYESVSKHPQSSHSVSDIPHNKQKNRFANIFPYDSSRVKLKAISGEDGSDYINASHLDGYNKPKAYIGAQGPLPNTVNDFWRMIWEKKLPTVIMLTRCFEGRKKCEEYWPLNVGESVQPGHGLTITLTSVLPFAEYSLRKMTVTCSMSPSSAPLKVTQFHFTGWPDHGVPQNGVTLINFIKRVRTVHPYSDRRPLLVHCSAGVGRTGAFIVLDSMLQRMKTEENLNIYEFLKQLRAQRVLMVQTQAQYNFIHDALNELILCGDTEITATNLRIIISRLNKTKDGETGYSKQFNLISQMTPGDSESDYTQANMECNVSRNRYPNILPNNHFRVVLRATAVTGSDYINASFVDGYRQRGAYIATQAPMENTVNDFWRMIWDYQSRAIVMLCRMKEDGKEACHVFLPDHKGESEVYGEIKVKLIAKENSTDYIIQHLEVSEDKPLPQGHASSSDQQVVKVGLFQYLRWPKHGTPRGATAILELIDYINKAQMSSGNKPITVMCNDGVGRTGTFICIHAQLERLKTEGVVDFFQSIKSARIQRAGFVPEVHQYILCHNVVADYLDGFDTYANFKELV